MNSKGVEKVDSTGLGDDLVVDREGKERRITLALSRRRQMVLA